MILSTAILLFVAYAVAEQAGEAGNAKPSSVISCAVFGLILSLIIGGAEWGLLGVVLTAFGVIVAAGIGYTRGETARKAKEESAAYGASGRG